MIQPFSETVHASSNRLWHKSQKKQTFKNCIAACCVYEGWLLFLKSLSLLTSVILSAFCPGVCQEQYLEYVLRCLSVFFKIDIPHPFLPPSPRFADSIRGMLKLILVLMLAGASLSSTWFTLTCLSRVTHLPSTAGGFTATSLSRWHCVQAVQLGCNPEPKWIQWAVQGFFFSDWFAILFELFYGFVQDHRCVFCVLQLSSYSPMCILDVYHSVWI